jgi:hypothetical protein
MDLNERVVQIEELVKSIYDIQGLEKFSKNCKQKLLDLQDDIYKAQEEKAKIITDIANKKEKFEKDMASQKDNFDRIVKAENERMDIDNKSTERKKETIDKMLAETAQLNNAAKALDAQVKEDFVKADKALDKFLTLKANYEKLLSDLSQKEMELNKKLQNIEPDLKAIADQKAEISLQEIAITKGNKDNAKRQAEIDQKESDIIVREKAVSKKEAIIEKKDNDLVKREADCREEEKRLTVMRSDLQTGQDNLKKLQEEYSGKIR